MTLARSAVRSSRDTAYKEADTSYSQWSSAPCGDQRE
jgi:hypothetical protein